MPLSVWDTTGWPLTPEAQTPEALIAEMGKGRDQGGLDVRPVLTMRGPQSIPMLRGGLPLFGVFDQGQLIAVNTNG